MPRPPRYPIADVPQHVVQRGNNRQRTFFRAQDRLRYLHWLREAAAEWSCDVHAYALMTNHVHLLVTPRQPGAIASMMQSVGCRYVRYLNDWRGRTGTLWEGRYKAGLVSSEEYLWMCHRYIELNPVRAGIVGDPARYRWSSFRRNALGRPDALVSEHGAYTALGPDPASRLHAYRRLFAIDLGDEELRKIRSDLDRDVQKGA
jgi:putative transposase